MAKGDFTVSLKLKENLQEFQQLSRVFQDIVSGLLRQQDKPGIGNKTRDCSRSARRKFGRNILSSESIANISATNLKRRWNPSHAY